MKENEDGRFLSIMDNIKVFSDVTKTLFFIIGCVFFGLLIIWWKVSDNTTTAILWSLACLASGGIVGFLFGIPRVLQDNPAVAVGNNNGVANNNSNDANNGNNNETNKTLPLSYRIMVNTNLEQISDWLTKIIVGLGLIELRNAPGYLNSLSGFFALGLGGGIELQSLAAAIIVYFIIVGFLGIYLMTRIYLAQVFSKADRETQQTANFGGERLTLQEFGEQVLKKVNDVENQVIINQPLNTNVPTDGTLEERVMTDEKLKVKSILWVDDNPKNNSLHVQSLNELGIKVTLALSTAEALTKLESENFDRIISDMGRVEGNQRNERAGIDFLIDLRSRGINTPFLIFCAPRLVNKYKREAIELGATIITSSSTELMKALKLDS